MLILYSNRLLLEPLLNRLEEHISGSAGINSADGNVLMACVGFFKVAGNFSNGKSERRAMNDTINC